MRQRYASEIRGGIMLAREVLAKRRNAPRIKFGYRAAPPLQLWERAYMHEISRAMSDGRLRPPKGRER